MNKYEKHLLSKEPSPPKLKAASRGLPIGSRVFLAPSSGYYASNTVNNPQNIFGTLIDSDTCMDCRVDWDNGGSNTYNWMDLILVPGTYIHD
jgi:hypothetical protein